MTRPVNTTLADKGFVARDEFSAEDEAVIGHIAGIDDIVGFHAESVPELVSAFREAADDFVGTCERIGKAPETMFSGELMVRVDPSVHAQAARAAERAGKSLAQWTEDALRAAARKSRPRALSSRHRTTGRAERP
ncbi:type II toxin-antitoxin system HicB family antitoxin [Methylobacterium nonmethylotrophicum]|uniref:Type II toxin-antitoxin system HicB family antitoxin n=2 Tax=Methylobacterium nonmethylotrophicum TaxID=1141884 RepID=A0A4Z0NEN1_9HYPH|nr:type II toxin-antitoxin system HicB family antitoxin [Methylobacterium nonmethylotrophicum]TGD94259.1 type II toxin-antitoxin system HicB family antitoxin [Methylobacterium nonmethylotrophicum]